MSGGAPPPVGAEPAPDAVSLRPGTIWNFAAFGVMALAGVLLNVFIGGQAGPRALGVFNQTFALVMIVSHLAALGLHNSALTNTARQPDPAERRAIAWSALLLIVVSGAAAAALLALLAQPIGHSLGSPETGSALVWAAPGVFFLAVNKVLLNLANGRRDMRAFALGHAARYLLMMALAAVWWWEGWSLAALGLLFAVPEAIVTLVFGTWTVSRIGLPRRRDLLDWLRPHVRFSTRGAVHGVLNGINARVDVLMLGVFLGDAEVGLYSLVAMLAEGFLNVLVVIRNQTQPVLAGFLARRRHAEIRALVRRLRLPLWAGATALAVVVLVGYPYAVPVLMPAGDYGAAWPALAILLAGLTVYAAFLPFDTLVMQGGRPGWQSVQMGLVVLANVVLNALLIPAFGLNGAAAATAVSQLLGAAVLLVLCHALFGFRLM